MRRSQTPKTVQRWIEKHPHIVEKIYLEKDYSEGFNDPWSMWIELHKGWWNPITECHLIHEPNARDALAMLKSVEKCECKDCLT